MKAEKQRLRTHVEASPLPHFTFCHRFFSGMAITKATKTRAMKKIDGVYDLNVASKQISIVLWMFEAKEHRLRLCSEVHATRDVSLVTRQMGVVPCLSEAEKQKILYVLWRLHEGESSSYPFLFPSITCKAMMEGLKRVTATKKNFKKINNMSTATKRIQQSIQFFSVIIIVVQRESDRAHISCYIYCFVICCVRPYI